MIIKRNKWKLLLLCILFAASEIAFVYLFFAERTDGEGIYWRRYGWIYDLHLNKPLAIFCFSVIFYILIKLTLAIFSRKPLVEATEEYLIEYYRNERLGKIYFKDITRAWLENKYIAICIKNPEEYIRRPEVSGDVAKRLNDKSGQGHIIIPIFLFKSKAAKLVSYINKRARAYNAEDTEEN